MKTSKQISLLMEARGRELQEKEENLDRIVITREEFQTCFRGYEDVEGINGIPILKKGVLIQTNEEFSDHLLFELREADGDTFRLYCEDFQAKEGLGPPVVLSCDISFMNKDDEVGIQLHSFENAYTAIYRKQKRDDLADQHMDEHLDSYISGVWGLYKVMAWINWLSEHPEIKKVEKDSPKEQNRRKPAQEKRSAPQQKEKALPTTREIRINGIRVVSSDEKLVRKLGSKVRQRLTETWGVRGHYRHYASGKTVYISPYTKGKKDGATVKKEYRLTMADTGVTEKN